VHPPHPHHRRPPEQSEEPGSGTAARRADRGHRGLRLGQVLAGLRHRVRRRQRRYVETFSPYARQFLDRMDKPATDRIEGIPPAIAIDQTNPVRTSRSTVGTMTELNDHLKLLFSRLAAPYCHGCGHKVQRDTRKASPECWPVPTAACHGHFPRETVPRAWTSRRCRRCWSARATPASMGHDNKRFVEVVVDRVRSPPTAGTAWWRPWRTALHLGQGKSASTRWTKTAKPLEPVATFRRPALRRLRPPLPANRSPTCSPSTRPWRLSRLPRLRPHHGHRLQPGDPGRAG
jgi:hypothetical protein